MKRVLLIAGGGTLGGYTSLELLKLGYAVDVLDIADRRYLNKNQRLFREKVSEGALSAKLSATHYDAVVDFMHYSDPEFYRRRLDLLAQNTDHYFFLSSYRVYADREHPLKEDSPQLLDVFGETGLLQNDTYGIPKSKEERIIRASGYRNYTILRPLISFSHYRLDLVTLSGYHLIPRAAEGKKVLLPAEARDKTAGVGWAGNAGKLIARLVLKPGAMGEDFLIGNDENLTWGQVADIYTETMGLSFVWADTEDYLKTCTSNRDSDRIILYHDRLYDRKVDNSKVREVTGMKKAEFVGVREALIYELSRLSENREILNGFFTNERAAELNRQTDEWLSAHGE